ncbi:hypothetical protein BOX15_Mlig029591g1, partial [Macrostomum lignano]
VALTHAGHMIRALHFVFKVGDRFRTAEFYRKVLGMRFLRHEEFTEGCAAACNGPYQGRWSKSMVGYGPEDEHFVLELTYNYGIGRYAAGNDFAGIVVSATRADLDRALQSGWPTVIPEGASDVVVVQSPDGHRFELTMASQYSIGDSSKAGQSRVAAVRLASSNLDATVTYWRDLLGFCLLERDAAKATLQPGAGQCRLEFFQLPGANPTVERAKAYGRVAFSCPADALPGIQAASERAGQKVLTPLLSLDTPGKATVQVVILADPDGHEICFVGDEAFRQLSQVDPKADSLLDEAMAGDKSAEWFAKRGGKADA